MSNLPTIVAVTLAAIAATLVLTIAQANDDKASKLTEKPKATLSHAAARAEADRRIATFANEHVHEQCAVHEKALATLKVEAAEAQAQATAEWRLVLTRSELELERCYRESMAGLAAFLGRTHLLERWGYTSESSAK
jgi:hypothetical protein